MNSHNAESNDALQTLSVQDVADILKCSPKKVGRLCQKGQFPKPIYIGRSRRWLKSVVLNFLHTLNHSAIGTAKHVRL